MSLLLDIKLKIWGLLHIFFATGPPDPNTDAGTSLELNKYLPREQMTHSVLQSQHSPGRQPSHYPQGKAQSNWVKWSKSRSHFFKIKVKNVC